MATVTVPGDDSAGGDLAAFCRSSPSGQLASFENALLLSEPHVQACTSLPVVEKLGGWQVLEMVLKYAHPASDYLARPTSTGCAACGW